MPQRKECSQIHGPPGLSRRDVLVGVAATALVAASSPVARASQATKGAPRGLPQAARARRYLAAGAPLQDGRILITGGYNRPFREADSPRPIASTLIFDPRTGGCVEAAPMRLARARHAAVLLQDGRVAVLGGFALGATASVEVYDPTTDTWTNSVPLTQPRYDHVAVTQGATVFIIGGSSLSMVPSVEAFCPDTSSYEDPIR